MALVTTKAMKGVALVEAVVMPTMKSQERTLASLDRGGESCEGDLRGLDSLETSERRTMELYELSGDDIPNNHDPGPMSRFYRSTSDVFLTIDISPTFSLI